MESNRNENTDEELFNFVGLTLASAIKKLEGFEVVIKRTETPMKNQKEKRSDSEDYVVRQRRTGEKIELVVSKFA